MYGLKLWTLRLEHQAEAAGAGRPTPVVAGHLHRRRHHASSSAAGSPRCETGTILALGLSVELLFLGSRWFPRPTPVGASVAISGALGATVLLFALIGTPVAGASHRVIGGALAFSAAALLYLVTEDC